MTLNLKRLQNPITRTERQGINDNWTKIENNFNNVVDKISDEAFDKVVDSARLIWKEPVDTFAELSTTYPDAVEGWTAWAREVVNGVAKAYRFNGTDWVLLQEFLGDAINEVDHRLSQQLFIEGVQISQLQTDKANKIEVNALINRKADKEEFELLKNTKADISYVNQQVQVSQASFKDSYPTLSDLQAAFPSGDNNKYAVLADGMIYAWVNGTWKNTQIQANGTGIARDSVSLDKTTFYNIKLTSNLFTPEWVAGGINGNTGADVPSPDFMRTDNFIEVITSNNYIVTLTGLTDGVTPYIYYYNGNQSIVSYTTRNNSLNGICTFNFSPASGVKYVRFSTYKAGRTTENLLPTTSQMTKSTTPTPYIPPRKYFINDNALDKVDVSNLLNLKDEDSLLNPQYPLFIRNKNLLIGEWELGNIDATTGLDRDESTMSRTKEYIPVLTQTDYTISFTGAVPDGIYIYCYNTNGNFLSRLFRYNNLTYTFKTPANTATIRVVLYSPDIYPVTAQLELGSLYTDYVKPDLVLKKHYLEDPEDQVENSLVKATAHMGYSSIAPENTLPAYILAKKHKFKRVECDLRFTEDGVPVLSHLDSINTRSNGTGKISELTLAQLREFDFGSWKSSEYAGTKIPTFDEFLLLCKKLDLHPYVDCKVDWDVATTTQIVTMVKNLGMLRNITWLIGGQSFFNLRAQDPIARVGITQTTPLTDYAYYASLITAPDNLFFNYDYNIITKEISDTCTEYGIGLEAFTVNDSSTVLRLAELNVQGIATDGINIGKILLDSVID